MTRVTTVTPVQFIRPLWHGANRAAGRREFDIARARARLDPNVIALASGKFGYWFWGYFNPAGHPAY